jgi:hypothetical protein
MVVANNEIDGDKKKENASNFDGHAVTAVRCGAHHPMECTCGFMQSH